ncbi:hypothetical protein [Embleya sp. NPDC020886]|uniref:hypothetical protein n=1 Tax=Embleya sp. NPDC020886 TaxID=3363980 RepID=UPI00378E3E12
MPRLRLDELLDELQAHVEVVRSTRNRVNGPDGDHVGLRARDDGVGPPAHPTRDSGLANTRERAESLGGTCSFRPAPDGGALLEWCVPLG